MKICTFSDIHGQLDFKIDPCDLVLICGDIVPLDIQSRTKPSEKWFKNTFIPWCNNLPCDKVLFIGGNHDQWIEHHSNKLRAMLHGQDKIVYLECEVYEYQGKRIYGTPLCKIFCNWSFMRPYEEQDEIYDKHLKIIGNIDIVMSHDAPYGVSDVLLQEDCWWADGSHIGNASLRRFIEKLNPSILVKGHLHSTSREIEKLGETKVYSVSLLNENYKMVYKPTYIEIE